MPAPAGAAAVLLPQREYLPTASFYRSCPTRQICAISDGITDYPRGGGFLTSAALSPVNNAVIMSCSHLRARRERGMSADILPDIRPSHVKTSHYKVEKIR
ncbi:hypothetical protein Bbelb_419490 [Branchiostoma belcheri]|nr:hypothetical protein Bbelb_419490 [Branchiostoma belcheri]